MAEKKMKRVEDSMVEQSYLLMPKCMNPYGYLFGGQLLAWLDETAGIVAKRHAEMNIVTVAVDNMYSAVKSLILILRIWRCKRGRERSISLRM